jgi:hypothetical protein
MSVSRRLVIGVPLLSLGLLLAACTGSPPEAVVPEPSTDADVYGGFMIDPPAADEVVLTLVESRTVELTLGELESMVTRDVSFMEPFVKAEQSFGVVPLVELFELAGIVPRDTVDTIALNDYRYQDSAQALLDADALLAVTRDGGPIPMNAGGPIRLVFDADSSYFEFLDAWNWSLRSIRVVAGG